MTYTNRTYLADAEGRECIRCFMNQDTIRAAHYNGLRQHLFGKGRGVKCADVVVADLCADCDAEFSEGKNGGSKSIERSEEFEFLVIMTLLRRLENGWELRRVRT